uniref:Uncharacterized protein n=1 Tax=Panagrellus redivivus TaxID=6233 RepID=A0A7E4VJP5_PANRE
MTHTGGVFGLGSERHDGNFYGILVEGSGETCPRHIVDGRSNFTVLELPNCPVIVEGAVLSKDKKTKPKTANSTVWIIPVCVGLVLLAIGIAIVTLYFCIRSKKKPLPLANSTENDERVPKSTKSPVSYYKKS